MKNLSFMNDQTIDGQLHNKHITPEVILQAKKQLHSQGWALLRDFEHNLTSFAQLFNNFCNKLTFDPARDFSNNMSQKVDAGTSAIGLHIENGNTPFPPDVIAFYSQKSAQQGSQTTLCDGQQIFNAMTPELKALFNEPITVERTLPEVLWKRYIASEHPLLDNPEQVTIEHVKQMMSQIPGQTASLNEQGELNYKLEFSPLIKGNEGKLAFANAILGPSFNYQKPRYFFKNGDELTDQLKQEIATLAEKFTIEHSWKNGDMILIDNTRIMHGRREIAGNPEERKLIIAMGIS
ncbi:TauD/TfdA family dioxygenase [Pseudoalteromonas denitrificans]|jgi:hypothetical protein|uniref:Taurine catabolism dioxygenase TauD, TfdA family n=1 Tax=Pseudoalteromonas denitrificans DSM 6059 TaxID=1123010 RepID=A0A1I1J793_9GAMM|nr:TauD/TfdA family dioxygenase [Pseudoalteromonas denitrificans]SFC42478.1 Taurine catabolism dioxygenase TauD, TfdA family [Pseudoalteromonas denitrificans DSM 6059]